MSKKNFHSNFDVVVVGAGVAGLAAVEALSKSRLRVCLVEGRARIGGRIHSIASGTSPIELGAEFIHGRPKETMAIVHKLGIPTFAMGGQNYQRDRSSELIAVPSIFDEMHTLLKQAGMIRSDAPFTETIARLGRRNVSVKKRRRLKHFLEVYNGADLSKTSTRFLSQSLDDTDNVKLRGRYNRIADHLLKAAADNVKIELQHTVKQIDWQPGGAKLVVFDQKQRSKKQLTADKVLVTIPVSLLKRTASPAKIKFRPALVEKRTALQNIEFGRVEKIILRFNKRFWPADMSVLYSPYTLFRHWLSTMPRRSTQLTGWIGGPRAQSVKNLSQGKVLRLALQSLSHIFSLPQNHLRQNLVSWHYHDWQNDPFTCGAYSYFKPGGTRASTELAKPVKNTLFFAGEATADPHRIATVDGAIASGHRAAKEILSKR